MKDLKADEVDYYHGSYEDLVESMEVETLLEVWDNDYQGDARLLVRDGERHGILIFGWGSCSGCDALEACSNVQEAQELRDEMWNSIHWEPTAKAMLDYTLSKDWSYEWLYHSREGQKFVQETTKYLTEACSANS